ncbi:SOS response-associated peptidase [Aeromicrobium sp. UC242_57]|uniref:SOS response-associated peptidase n=1 Tax=Aeromicrobium sp. UC242_57 TaxID=3374624 RepID=UPI0037933839
MCGRYATTQTAATLNQAFEVDLARATVELEPDYNVAPTKLAPVVIGRRSDDGPAVQRELLTARWGLIPSWAKDPSIGSRMINARTETVAEKPSFKNAFAKRRALVPADGYYEWYTAQLQPGRRRPRSSRSTSRPRTSRSSRWPACTSSGRTARPMSGSSASRS